MRAVLAERTVDPLVIAAASPPNRHGYFSLGLNADYVSSFIGRARFFLEANVQMPRTFGRNQIHVSQVLGWVDVDRPWAPPSRSTRAASAGRRRRLPRSVEPSRASTAPTSRKFLIVFSAKYNRSAICRLVNPSASNRGPDVPDALSRAIRSSWRGPLRFRSRSRAVTAGSRSFARRRPRPRRTTPMIGSVQDVAGGSGHDGEQQRLVIGERVRMRHAVRGCSDRISRHTSMLVAMLEAHSQDADAGSKAWTRPTASLLGGRLRRTRMSPSASSRSATPRWNLRGRPAGTRRCGRAQAHSQPCGEGGREGEAGATRHGAATRGGSYRWPTAPLGTARPVPRSAGRAMAISASAVDVTSGRVARRRPHSVTTFRRVLQCRDDIAGGKLATILEMVSWLAVESSTTKPCHLLSTSRRGEVRLAAAGGVVGATDRFAGALTEQVDRDRRVDRTNPSSWAMTRSLT